MLTTIDYILGKKLILEQPKEGYRIAIDPLFLAASINPTPSSTVLDVGCGVGTAALCLAQRSPTVHIDGFDSQEGLVNLATHNAKRNDLHHGTAFKLDFLETSSLTPLSYDYVMTNPPFYNLYHTPAKNSIKKVAHQETVSLHTWLRFCVRMLRFKGVLTLIHLPERLGCILEALVSCGNITIYPLWPKVNKPAKRLLIQATKGSRAPLICMPGIVLHDDKGHYTPEVQAILRGEALLNIK